MSIFDSLKKQAVRVVLRTNAAQQMIPLVTDALRKAEGTSVEVLSSPTLFRSRVSYPSYTRLPLPVQALLSPEQWHEVMFSLKDQWFMVQDGKLRLQPEFQTTLKMFVQQLLYGKKAVERKRSTHAHVEQAVIDVESKSAAKEEGDAR